MEKDTQTTVMEYASPAMDTLVKPGEVILGNIASIDAQGQVLVDYPGNASGRPKTAVSTIWITAKHVGRQVALLFANGDLQKPVVMGLIHSPLSEMLENYELTPVQDESVQSETVHDLKQDDISIDGKRLVLEGQEEIVLRCGEASITLTRAGKILIRGKYLLNRSTGVNRIMGGSVQVN